MGSTQTVKCLQLLAAEALLLTQSHECGEKVGVWLGSCVRRSGNTWAIPLLTDLSVALPKINYSQKKQETGIRICRLHLVDLKLSLDLAASAAKHGWKLCRMSLSRGQCGGLPCECWEAPGRVSLLAFMLIDKESLMTSVKKPLLRVYLGIRLSTGERNKESKGPNPHKLF